VHRQRRRRVHRKRRAVGPGHGHHQRAVETVAPGPATVDQRQSDHTHGNRDH